MAVTRPPHGRRDGLVSIGAAARRHAVRGAAGRPGRRTRQAAARGGRTRIAPCAAGTAGRARIGSPAVDGDAPCLRHGVVGVLAGEPDRAEAPLLLVLALELDRLHLDKVARRAELRAAAPPAHRLLHLRCHKHAPTRGPGVGVVGGRGRVLHEPRRDVDACPGERVLAPLGRASLAAEYHAGGDADRSCQPTRLAAPALIVRHAA